MKYYNVFYAMLIIIITGISDKLRAAHRLLPHTVKFKNISSKPQLVWIKSEYAIKPVAAHLGRDCFCKALVPGESFKYGGEKCIFTALDIRLNSAHSIVPTNQLNHGFMVIGLAEPISKVTIFDEEGYTVSNAKSLRKNKLLKIYLKVQAARKMLNPCNCLSIEKPNYQKWDFTSSWVGNLPYYSSKKAPIHVKKRIKKHIPDILTCETELDNKHEDHAEKDHNEPHPEEEEEDELDEEENENTSGNRRRAPRTLRRSLHSLKKKLFSKKRLLRESFTRIA